MRRLKCNKDNTDVYKNSTLAELLGLQLRFQSFCMFPYIFFLATEEEEGGILRELKLVFWPKSRSLKIIGLSKAVLFMMDMATFTVRKTLECNPKKNW